MDIDEKFADENMQAAVALMVQEYEEIFYRIRTMTKSDLCAWFAVQAWVEWQEKESRLAETRRKPKSPASSVQLCLLNGLGVEKLADLSRAEAQGIIENAQKENNGKAELGWY